MPDDATPPPVAVPPPVAAPPPESGPKPVDGPALVDPFGRTIRYLRLSVTDRCDLRCVYCMAEQMTFLPKAEVLTLEELDRLGSLFVARGVRQLRITGGEPLVRRNVVRLFERLGRHLDGGGLDELTLTTNGSRLAAFAGPLARAGVRRINVSLDTLDPQTYRALTRGGDVAAVLAGLDAAVAAGLRVKINTVALRGVTERDIDRLIGFCGDRGFDLTLIETMPLGDVAGDRTERYLPLDALRRQIAARWTLDDVADRTGGPARYARIADTGGRLGFITPLTQNFCAGCNRVRVTCTGRLFQCLGRENQADLRAPLRASADDGPLDRAIDAAVTAKPWGHEFVLDADRRTPALSRHMSVTGG
ncbi:GTP 3',8-cyclase MoaA [Rhodothalassium salexigens]|uniref:GTP 3',8-cyclase MoaA n=1 Tax=Rhodothalassium salexigens TaxID=1086 RepID=UPI00191229A9|nr:GTP 3',8-cyclase MoaA [Rhodothalassium salexigens]MBK5919812.1 GTP 3',8-cyclase MoaA [Rhodothalassium salexigens]